MSHDKWISSLAMFYDRVHLVAEILPDIVIPRSIPQFVSVSLEGSFDLR
jgi:hypothetical protein